MLRFAKLSLFSRIIAKSPPVLLDMIVAQSSFSKGWCNSLMQDLAWLLPFLEVQGAPPSCIDEWIGLISTSPGDFRKKVRRHCKSPFANICAQWAISPVLRVYAAPVTCAICSHVSRSTQAHSVHMFRAHDVKSNLRRYVPFTYCTVCLREFGQRETCLNHVRYRSKVCRSNLLLRGPLLSCAEAQTLDEECHARNRALHSAGRRRHHVESPSFVLPGPLLPVLLAPGEYSAHHPLGRGHRYI